jgi:hypothetical protein
MSTFWKNTFEVVTGVVSLPVIAVVSAVNALDSHKTFGEAWDDNSNEADSYITKAGKFGKEHGHHINHGIVHVAKHLVKGR